MSSYLVYIVGLFRLESTTCLFKGALGCHSITRSVHRFQDGDYVSMQYVKSKHICLQCEFEYRL